MYRNRKLLDAMREIPCVNCQIENGTIVAAHSNQFKGMGIKSPDHYSSSLCFTCHSMLDQSGEFTKDQRRQIERDWNLATLRALVERGILVVK